MKVLLFGTFDRELHPRMEAIRQGLSKQCQVSVCNEPLRLSSQQRTGVLRNPLKLFRVGGRFLSCWFALTKQAHRGERPDAVVVGYLGHFDILLARLLFRRSLLALDHLVFLGDTARDRGAHWLVIKCLGWLDAVALRAADIVIFDTTEHAAMAPADTDATVVPVGAPAAWYKSSARRGPLAPLKVVFFGVYSPLQGAQTIARAIAQLDQGAFEFLMIGDGPDRAEATRIIGDRSDVHWLDWVAVDELPALVADRHVCLGIFGVGDKAQRVIPNKVYQGAAAGCAIITADSEPVRRAIGDAIMMVPAGDAQALAQRLQQLAEQPALLTRLQQSSHHWAEQLRPQIIVEPLVAALQTQLGQEQRHS